MPAPGTFRIVTVEDRRPAIVCLLCLHTSHNIQDVSRRYCPFCHLFHDVVMEARAYHEGGLTHECDEWRTAAGHCAICVQTVPTFVKADQIARGVYVTERGGLHLDVKELLEANGFRDTPANREMVIRVAVAVMRHYWPDIKIEDV